MILVKSLLTYTTPITLLESIKKCAKFAGYCLRRSTAIGHNQFLRMESKVLLVEEVAELLAELTDSFKTRRKQTTSKS